MNPPLAQPLPSSGIPWKSYTVKPAHAGEDGPPAPPSQCTTCRSLPALSSTLELYSSPSQFQGAQGSTSMVPHCGAPSQTLEFR